MLTGAGSPPLALGPQTPSPPPLASLGPPVALAARDDAAPRSPFRRRL
jgi:hypothetical protein